MIDCCAEGRQRVLYHCLDFKAIIINEIFFEFTKFWWFILLETPLSDVCSECHAFVWLAHSSLSLSLYEIHAISLRHFFRVLCCQDRSGTFQERVTYLQVMLAYWRVQNQILCCDQEMGICTDSNRRTQSPQVPRWLWEKAWKPYVV